jgi:ribose-phosphate pyrophosphokinase
MQFAIFAGTANVPLAEALAAELGLPLGAREVGRFPDGEIRVELGQSVRGHDVYLVQPTAPPVADNLLELLFLADAARRAGAARLTALVPYFGYARQDRRAAGREPVAARLVAELVQAAGVDRVVAVDLHSPAIEGFFRAPLEHLSAVPLLAVAARDALPPDPVVVAPDLGAVKLAERYARALTLPVAVVHKTRVSPESATVRALTGDVRGRTPVVVDDMISTGGTVEAAGQALLAAGCVPEMLVVATHALLVGAAVERLRVLPVRRLIATDSVASPAADGLPLQTVGLAPLLADAVKRLHHDESLADLLVHA